MTDDARFALGLIIAAVVIALICVDAAREKRTRRHPRHADQGLHVAYQRPEVRTMGEER